MQKRRIIPCGHTLSNSTPTLPDTLCCTTCRLYAGQPAVTQNRRTLPPSMTFTERERKRTISSQELYCFPPADDTLRAWNAAVFTHPNLKNRLAMCKSERVCVWIHSK